MSDAKFNEDGLAFETGYQAAMNEIILPGLKALRQDSMVPGWQNRELFCSRYDAENPRGTVLMVHGFTECGDKFSELIWSLLRNHWSVVAYDQRGHGRSWREPNTSDSSVVYVEHFSDYVRDLEAVCARVLSGMPKPWMVFSHSMGGAVTAWYLELHDGETFDRAVFCAPMIACHRGGVPLGASFLITGGAQALHRGKKRMFFSRPYTFPDDFETSCTNSRARFDWYEQLRAERPELQTNGPSYQWTLNALSVTHQLLGQGRPEAVSIPVLLYTAEKDTSVLPDAQKQFIARVPHGVRKDVPGSRHEIYRCVDSVLHPWWHEVLSFLSGQDIR